MKQIVLSILVIILIIILIVLLVGAIISVVPEVLDGYEDIIERLDEHKAWKQSRKKKKVDLDKRE